jgi:hypothetical protein
MFNRGDVDIDLSDRDRALIGLKHTASSIITKNEIKKHNTGVYFHQVPIDPVTGACSIDYQDAKEARFYKIDLLNVNVYKDVRDEDHLIKLMTTPPDWKKLYNKEYFSKLIHIGNHYDILCKMPEPLDSIDRMAMFLAIIRPGKKELINKTWDEISKTVWLKDLNSKNYAFSKAHAIAYAHLLIVHMNLINQQDGQQL